MEVVRAELARVTNLARAVSLGAIAGVLAGLSSYAFLWLLAHTISFFQDHDALLYALPLGGVAIGAVYHYLGGRSHHGNALLLEQIHEPTAWLPRRMAPLVLLGTLGTHLFGGSVGREGTALQMAGSLCDSAARLFRLGAHNRRLLLIAALAGGFGAVFGVPIGGAVFALEVQSIGRVHYDALVPSLTAALIGDGIVRALGYHHDHYASLAPHLDAALVLKVAIAALAFGLTGAAFAELTHLIKRVMSSVVPWLPLRAAIGGLAVIGLVALFGRDYLGLSLPLAATSLAGHQVASNAFALKLLFTAVCLGCGFPGGEVTPLFVIGACLGSTLAGPLNVSPALLAAVGFVAVFAAAANTPLACAVMAAELFGAGAIVPAAVACVIAFAVWPRRGIYTAQRDDAVALG